MGNSRLDKNPPQTLSFARVQLVGDFGRKQTGLATPGTANTSPSFSSSSFVSVSCSLSLFSPLSFLLIFCRALLQFLLPSPFFSFLFSSLSPHHHQHHHLFSIFTSSLSSPPPFPHLLHPIPLLSIPSLLYTFVNYSVFCSLFPFHSHLSSLLVCLPISSFLLSILPPFSLSFSSLLFSSSSSYLCISSSFSISSTCSSSSFFFLLVLFL